MEGAICLGRILVGITIEICSNPGCSRYAYDEDAFGFCANAGMDRLTAKVRSAEITKLSTGIFICSLGETPGIENRKSVQGLRQ